MARRCYAVVGFKIVSPFTHELQYLVFNFGSVFLVKSIPNSGNIASELFLISSEFLNSDMNVHSSVPIRMG